MSKIVLILLSGFVLSGCVTNSHYPRAYGEDWKIYPFEEGYSTKVAEQGRRCWAESNRENWDQCE